MKLFKELYAIYKNFSHNSDFSHAKALGDCLFDP